MTVSTDISQDHQVPFSLSFPAYFLNSRLSFPIIIWMGAWFMEQYSVWGVLCDEWWKWHSNIHTLDGIWTWNPRMNLSYNFECLKSSTEMDRSGIMITKYPIQWRMLCPCMQCHVMGHCIQEDNKFCSHHCGNFICPKRCTRKLKVKGMRKPVSSFCFYFLRDRIFSRVCSRSTI